MDTLKALSLFEQAVVEQLTEERDNNYTRASVTGKCPRQLGYIKLGMPRKKERARGLLTLDLGKTIETQICDILEKTGLLKNRQLEVSHTLPCGTIIAGHIDGILTLDNQDYVYDAKSSAYRGYQEIAKDPNYIDESYKAQMCIYMKALDLPSVFHYYKKDTSHTMFVEQLFDRAVYDRINLKYLKLQDVTTIENLPERGFKPSEKTGNLPWQCSRLYCPFSELCYPDVVTTFVKGKPKENVKQCQEENK